LHVDDGIPSAAYRRIHFGEVLRNATRSVPSSVERLRGLSGIFAAEALRNPLIPAAFGGSAIGDWLAPGTGFPAIQAARTGVKRRDPMVFHGTVSRTVNLERGRYSIFGRGSD
jgi:hypothetical protein